MLEDFAAQIAAGGTSENIEQVYDQYLNFVVSEPNLFSLGMGKDVYYTMNSAQTSDEEIDAKVDRIVSGLFSVAVTMGELINQDIEWIVLNDFLQARYPSSAVRRVAQQR